MSRTLDEVLQSTLDVLYPGEIDGREVAIDSCGCDGDTPLHVMAWRNDVEAVELLLHAGANVNAAGDMGETPLHVAVSQDNPEMVAAMLKAGARGDIRSEFGDTPRERAMRRKGAVERLFVGE